MRESDWSSDVCSSDLDIEYPANDKAAYVEGIPPDIESRQELQVCKAKKEGSKEDRIKRINQRIVYFPSCPDDKKVLNGRKSIPYATCEEGNCQGSQ
jgi:hypothetical protein